jgi:simple sugar transport system permease protein
MARDPSEVPRWVDYGLVPLVNLLVALLLTGLVVIAVGADPWQALNSLVAGAVASSGAVGFTLYYATNFIFAGLAVAIAFHAGLFNIGGEGQAYIGGLGVALVCLAFDHWSPWIVLPLAVMGSALFGAAWAFIPGYLQAKRGSHIVITTIMFNFIASALMVYLLVDVLIQQGQQAPRTRDFAEGVWLPTAQVMLGWLGIPIGRSPLNAASLVAVFACIFVWIFVWHTRWGYEIRTVGHSERAARYAGISRSRAIVLAMLVSGALAGFIGVNDVLGVHHHLLTGFTGGVGFVGIAVALMGRNHPLGVVLASLLFGALYQGGSDLAFDIPQITREMVVVIQGLVILFCGALENMFKPHIVALFRPRRVREAAV